MKRSLMVLKLAEALMETQAMSWEDTADDVLTRLEKAGMVPPMRTIYHVDPTDPFYFEEKHEWEPENESNEEG
jgi:hypothetical protein